MKIYKSTRAKNILEERREKFISFGKDENGYFIISRTEDSEDMTERRLSFTDDCIIIKSTSTGKIKFVPEFTTDGIEICNY